MEPTQLYALATRAVRILRARQKEISKEHSERIKRIDQVRERLEPAMLGGDRNAQLFNVEDSIDPELRNLISNPTEGLKG